MSKDAETLIEMGILTKLQALDWHIKCNFYPPHPKYVRESMIEGFKKYWAGQIDEIELQNACYLKEVSGLYRYFSEFMDMEQKN